MDTSNSEIDVETIENSQGSKTVRSQFSQGKTPASIAVVETLSEVLDADPVELAPLNDTMDTDALDALVRVRNKMRGDTHITFVHDGHTITVHSYGVVEVTLEDERPAEQHEMNSER